MIEFSGVSKTYRVAKRQAGMGNALKSFFSREYNLVHALRDVSFTIGDGEMVGYIGPNGAGKSTTIKIMCGVLTPDDGACTVNGRIPYRERVAHVRDIGVVFGQRSQLWWDVPVADSFELIRDIYKVKEDRYRKNLSDLSELLNLGDILQTPVRNLSLGQRMRCEIAASLLHDPGVLFLDEPTIGLDAVSKIAVRRFLRRLNEEKGTTILLTTHDMQDIEALTRRVLLIGKGRVLMDGNLAELKKHISSRKTMTAEYRGPAPALREGMELVQSGEGRIVIRFDPSEIPVSEAVTYFAQLTELTDVSVSDITAEEMAAGLYKEYDL
ncbi:MAG: ABC transporter ATP-binding protein [Lachnospiraceae bacterium]|nr:ATP-binding cassette domain-containing protein [Lachnospiraceae bacterium]MDE6816865.1 ABC transporter ATP-binding protein [Lachnospiraceae bacterium]MDE6975634.1 ABC transporter ATP-binding protein [Lachnospiraceae bacterium]